jgi:hypothetical protein
MWKNEVSPRSEQIPESIIPNKDVNKEKPFKGGRWAKQ